MDRHWCDILGLPQVTQGTQEWLAARCMKQTGSDFAAVVPRTAEFIGHIVDRWQYKDFAYSETATCAKSLTRLQYLRDKCQAAIKFKTELFANAPQGTDPQVSSSEKEEEDLDSAMSVGKRFENLIRNATIQLLGTHISEVGWVQDLKTQGAGVSPDGIVHCTTLPPKPPAVIDRAPIAYVYGGGGLTLNGGAKENIDLYNGSTIRCTRSFEAKTLVTRRCDQKVPLQYHIQVEKNMYELGLHASLYSEGGFIELSSEEWVRRRSELEDECDPRLWKHLKLGCLLLLPKEHKGHDRYIWPHAYVRTPAQFLAWRDMTLAWYHGKFPDVPLTADPTVIYFELETLWCIDIPLRPDYDAVYAPMIDKEIQALSYVLSDPETFLETNKSKARPFVRKPKNHLIDADI